LVNVVPASACHLRLEQTHICGFPITCPLCSQMPLLTSLQTTFESSLLNFQQLKANQEHLYLLKPVIHSFNSFRPVRDCLPEGLRNWAARSAACSLTCRWSQTWLAPRMHVPSNCFKRPGNGRSMGLQSCNVPTTKAPTSRFLPELLPGAGVSHFRLRLYTTLEFTIMRSADQPVPAWRSRISVRSHFTTNTVRA